MAISYTKKMFVERIKRHINNGWPTLDFSISDNEILLFVDQAIAYTIVGQTYQNAKVQGVLEISEGWLLTYQLPTLMQDTVTGDWYTTLPNPPLSLPLGYSITKAYFKDSDGVSMHASLIRSKRLSYRSMLPAPACIMVWAQGNKFYAAASNGAPLIGLTPYVEMPASRTQDINENMTMPDDAQEIVFQSVVGKLKERFGIPQDTVLDNLPAGNKTS